VDASCPWVNFLNDASVTEIEKFAPSHAANSGEFLDHHTSGVASHRFTAIERRAVHARYSRTADLTPVHLPVSLAAGSLMTADVRKGMPDARVSKDVFRTRFFNAFYDPAFDAMRPELEKACDAGWQAYEQSRKAPRTQPAGPEFADPDYELSVEWRAARDAVKAAEARHRDPGRRARILLINGSPRSEHTCPGEMSKTYRLVATARETLATAPDTECELLDLSRLASEYGRRIYPCKACFSTAPTLCHWPCSCYPNHALGQVNDWMADIYPMWVAAHGIMIVSPVHWYQAPAALKLMMDRLVCADGGNPDPSATHGKDPARAKDLEPGWSYPRHLANRVFAVVVHGDAAGAENLRRMLTDWLTDMHLRPAGDTALLDRYVGYYRPYATSHADLDADGALFEEVRHAALTLREAVTRYREGETAPGSTLPDPRPK
jgi:multimeric flavodoxin WrbA